MKILVTGGAGYVGSVCSAHLVENGHEVTVVTCAPNFPEGRLFEGYRNRWRHVEHIDGIRVVRVKTYITANEGFLKRLAGLGGGVVELAAQVQGVGAPATGTIAGGRHIEMPKETPLNNLFLSRALGVDAHAVADADDAANDNQPAPASRG